MAKYVLENLLDIRKRREDEMAQQVTEARTALGKAQEGVQAAERKLTEFVTEKPERQARLYAAVMRQIVRRDQLDKLKVALAELEQEQLALQEQVKLAKEAVTEAEKALEQAQKNLLLATKNKMKLDSHKETWLEEEAKVAADLAEKELEDLHSKLNPIADDDDAL